MRRGGSTALNTWLFQAPCQWLVNLRCEKIKFLKRATSKNQYIGDIETTAALCFCHPIISHIISHPTLGFQIVFHNSYLLQKYIKKEVFTVQRTDIKMTYLALFLGMLFVLFISITAVSRNPISANSNEELPKSPEFYGIARNSNLVQQNLLATRVRSNPRV